MPNDATSYRKEAERAKRRAELARDPDMRQQWLVIEASYRRLARSAEAQAKVEELGD
jgi:hypothetical protein